MPCSLVHLSDELYLNILQELLKNDEFLHEESLKPDTHWGHQDRDDDFQYHRDLMNWSCTSLYFRNLLAPYIFKSIKLCNNEKSGASVDALLKGPHGALVKGIYFLGTNPPDMAAEQVEKPITVTIPPIIEVLLSDLHQISSLESLSIGFTYPDEDLFDEYYTTGGETPQAARASMALMTTTYEALLRNETPQLKAVEIRLLLWTFTEPYESQSFRKFLSHVQHFSLSVRGGGAGRYVNTYLDCVSRFDELFFDHLASAISVTLRGTEQGPIGLEERCQTRLALKKEQMPRLKTLHLRYIIICQEVGDFVTSHADTLEQLTLRDCCSSVDEELVNDGYFWASFFNKLHRADLLKLSRLEIWPHNAPLTRYEGIWQAYPRYHLVEKAQTEPDNVQQIRRLLGEDANRRLFAYVMLSENYGTCEVDEDESQAAFERGEDQVAFDRLMEEINANAG